ncbi:MAG: radical SAM protein [Magnetococcales bacterium]|nr:radical SAM protein [Magnetococcales bacterium]
MKIYLADLVYDTIQTNIVVPLNIAYIAAALSQRFPEDVEIKLFKFPSLLEKAIKESPPDVLGLSHYSWNTRLNQAFIEFCKDLNPGTVCVMGGPNIRVDRDGVYEFLKKIPLLDYYIMFEGEEPFLALAEYLLSGKRCVIPENCATLIDGQLVLEFADLSKREKEIDLPSPYLTGWLDEFLRDENLMPLLETNRGCPFGCVYCAWGIAALSKVRLRPMHVVLQEIDYIAGFGVKHPVWVFCDANFGILPRDVKIARKIRDVMENKAFGPSAIQLWASKNSTERNIEITNIVSPEGAGGIAIQSADKEVLIKSGRGKINFNRLAQQINNFRENNLEVMTDILIGLPGETAESHQKTLCSSFDMGFGKISPMNIRLLPGTEYESLEFRNTYQVKTKFRPIFGCYGIVNGKYVFELEESIRATKDMTETELNRFKVMHWLIYLTWNLGLFKPILRFAQECGINPAQALSELQNNPPPLLKELFLDIEQKSMDEWFDTEEEMIHYYNIPENFNLLTKHFVKLNFLYIAKCYVSNAMTEEIRGALQGIIGRAFRNGTEDETIMKEIFKASTLIVSGNILQGVFSTRMWVHGRTAAYIIGSKNCADRDMVELEISRPPEYVDFCRHYLEVGGEPNLTEHTLTRFLEAAGAMDRLRNRVRLVS